MIEMKSNEEEIREKILEKYRGRFDKVLEMTTINGEHFTAVSKEHPPIEVPLGLVEMMIEEAISESKKLEREEERKLIQKEEGIFHLSDIEEKDYPPALKKFTDKIKQETAQKLIGEIEKHKTDTKQINEVLIVQFTFRLKDWEKIRVGSE